MAVVVCDDRLNITCMCLGKLGASRDSAVYKGSELYLNPSMFFGPSEYLLGDKGFALTTRLVTPFWESSTTASRNLRNTFNAALSSQRVQIEHVFGLKKERFSGIKCIDRRNWRLGHILIEVC